VLVGGGPAEPGDQNVRLVASDAAGTTLGTAEGDGLRPKVEWHEACNGPDALPAPGPDQPADPAAARAAITDAFIRAWSVPEKREPVSKNAPRDVAEFTLDEIVFLSPAHAALRYHVDMGSETLPQFDEARLVDGEWQTGGWAPAGPAPDKGAAQPNG
jgi:hypothetical protein